MMMINVDVKDFTENVVHHIVTLTLMVLSWTGNMTRVGTLIMCIHDAVDYILEVSFLYAYHFLTYKCYELCNVFFVYAVWALAVLQY